VLLAALGLAAGADLPYQVGVGRADVTGPSVQIEMVRLLKIVSVELLSTNPRCCQMGYANPAQIGEGIHLRQYSRAFIIGDGKSRVVFVSADICMGTQIMAMKVSVHSVLCH